MTLGSLALGGSAAILLLALAGRSTRARYGARWRCWAWLLLCLRLALPLPLLPQSQVRAPIQVPIPPDTAWVQGADLTPSPSVEDPARPEDGQAVRPAPGVTSSASSSGPVSGSERRPLPSPTSPSLPSPAQLLAALWLAGAVAVLLWNSAAHLRFLSYLRRWSAPVADGNAIQIFNALGDRLKLDRRPRLLICQGLPVPMLAGLFRPVLLLPADGLSVEDLTCSLLHELTHFRRRDIWLKTLALWVKALYWFDPLVWLMCRLIERDTELACDEAVLRLLPPEDRGAYGRAILSSVSRLKQTDP